MGKGLVVGGVTGAVWALSLYSIATVTLPIAAAFAATWLAILVLGSAVAGAGLERQRLRGLVFGV